MALHGPSILSSGVPLSAFSLSGRSGLAFATREERLVVLSITKSLHVVGDTFSGQSLAFTLAFSFHPSSEKAAYLSYGLAHEPSESALILLVRPQKFLFLFRRVHVENVAVVVFVFSTRTFCVGVGAIIFPLVERVCLWKISPSTVGPSWLAKGIS